jgi:hypothetical protein
MTGRKEGGMQRMNGRIVLSHGSLAVTHLSQESVELWHERFGHTVKGATSDLTKGEAVSGLRNAGTDNGCDICVKEKETNWGTLCAIEFASIERRRIGTLGCDWSIQNTSDEKWKVCSHPYVWFFKVFWGVVSWQQSGSRKEADQDVGAVGKTNWV